jgi:hypothetical protein
LDRMYALNPSQPIFEEQKISALLQQLRDHPPLAEATDAEQLRQLQLFGCDADDAPYVVTRLAWTLAEHWEINLHSALAAAVASAFLDPACEGARGVSRETTALLKGVSRPPFMKYQFP